MQKIILFYKFTKISDVQITRLWLRSLALQFNLKGRIIIAGHGINGTLGGELRDIKDFIKEYKSYKPLINTDFKYSPGDREDFPKLSVKVRPEIVTFLAADKIEVNENGIIGGGKKITPTEVHKLKKKYGQDLIFFDGRNKYEADIGKFKNAVITDVSHTREFKKELKKGKYNNIKNKPIITYCTGGIRCEVLTVLMKDNGFKEVYQIDGGIVKYGEVFKDGGLWEGALYVFDKRMATKFSDKGKDIGRCRECKILTSNYENCANKSCNKLILICFDCQKVGMKLCQDCVLTSFQVKKD